MKNNIFWLSLFIALLGAFFIIPNTLAASILTDIDGHKYQTAIEFLEEAEVIHGNPDGTFLPDQGVNRAEILKLYFETSGEFLVEPTVGCFPDVPANEWFSKYVCTAKELGHIEGYPDGTYHPEQLVNKVEALKMSANFLEWDLAGAEDEPLYQDTSTDEWYAPFLQYAKKANLFDQAGNLYHPADDMLRGDIAEMIFRTVAIKYLEIDAFGSDTSQAFLDAYNQPEIVLTGACADPDLALDVVLTEIVDNEANKDTLEIFRRDLALVEGDSFVWIDGTAIGQERMLLEGEEKWFFWIDTAPTARFSHDTKVATVNTEDCLIEEYESQLWPAINGVEMWSTDEERAENVDLVHRGFAGIVISKSVITPSFGTCGADPAARKRAIVVYVGKDTGIKRDAVNMHTFLCSKDYVTTVITGATSATVMTDIETELKAIETASHGESLNNFFFYTVSHGLKATGDLVVGTVAIGPIDVISLDVLTAKMGEIAYTIGTAGIWSDSFTVVQDSCYSGNAIPKYQAEAYIPPTREGAVGWVSASSSATEPGYAYNGTSVYTDAIISCYDSIVPYANIEECIKGKTQNNLPSGAGVTQSAIYEKLTPITDDMTPFIP